MNLQGVLVMIIWRAAAAVAAFVAVLASSPSLADASCSPSDYGLVIGGTTDQNVSPGPNFGPIDPSQLATLTVKSLLDSLRKGPTRVSSPGALFHSGGIFIQDPLPISKATGPLTIEANGDLVVHGLVTITGHLTLSLHGYRIDQSDCGVRPGNGRTIQGGSLALRGDYGIGTQPNAKTQLIIQDVDALAAKSEYGNINITSSNSGRLCVGRVADLEGISANSGSINLLNVNGSIAIHRPITAQWRVSETPSRSKANRPRTN